jgi:NADH-quinone oxidoreductase subunit E
MLTELEKKEILEESKLYPNLQAACIDALKVVQHHRRWLSDEAIKDIAAELGMSADEVDSIATFYTRLYRKPVGRNIILICDGVSCMVMGYESLYDYLSKTLGIRFGETTQDGRFTLLPVTCLGDCNHSPSIMINDNLHNGMNIGKLEELLPKYE